MKYANSRIPVKALDYKNKEKALPRELLVDYDKGRLYVVDSVDKTIVHDITENIIKAVGNTAFVGGEIKVNIDGIGELELGKVLSTIYNSFIKTRDIDTTNLTIKTLIDRAGNAYAPRTLARAVYTSNGTNVEQRLLDITKIGMVTRSIGINYDSSTNKFPIPFPFVNYLENGNHMVVFLDGVYLDKSEYTVVNGEIIISKTISIGNYKSLMFLFMYNSTTPVNIGTNQFDGSFISNWSIDPTKISKISDSVSLDDHNSIASSKALKTLNDILSQRINAINPNAIPKYLLAYGDSDMLFVSIPDYELVDTAIFNVRVQVDINSNAKFKLNNKITPIYVDYDTPLRGGTILAGDLVKLYYNQIDDRFYVYTEDKYRIQKYRSMIKPGEKLTSIQVNLPNYDPSFDALSVYQKNVPIFEDINYTKSGNSINLIGYETTEDDVFIFEISKIVKVRL